MGHHHSHNHSHDHSHNPHSENAGKSLVIAMIFNLVYAGIEAGIGLTSGSLALLSDAGHNLMDVSSLLLAWIAIKLQEKKTISRIYLRLEKIYNFSKSTQFHSHFWNRGFNCIRIDRKVI